MTIRSEFYRNEKKPKRRPRPRILSVSIVREVDNDPDLSFIGEYSMTDKGKAHAIDRQARGDMLPREFRFFIPANSAEETGNADSPEQDYQRMEDYNRLLWCMVGVYAEARFELCGVIQRFQSSGVWGIESDSDESCFAEIEQEQLNELREQLGTIGVPRKALALAFANVERKG